MWWTLARYVQGGARIYRQYPERAEASLCPSIECTKLEGYLVIKLRSSAVYLLTAHLIGYTLVDVEMELDGGRELR